MRYGLSMGMMRIIGQGSQVSSHWRCGRVRSGLERVRTAWSGDEYHHGAAVSEDAAQGEQAGVRLSGNGGCELLANRFPTIRCIGLESALLVAGAAQDKVGDGANHKAPAPLRSRLGMEGVLPTATVRESVPFCSSVTAESWCRTSPVLPLPVAAIPTRNDPNRRLALR